MALLLALLASGLLLVGTGHDPLHVYAELIRRTLLRPEGVQEVGVRAIPLLLTGLAVLIAARAGLWNIGIDGQVLVGALAAAAAGTYLDGLGKAVLWTGAILAGALAGVAWVAIPAIMRMRWGTNEIVTTIMFNYLALSLTAWLVKGPLRDESLVAPQTRLIPRDLRFGFIFDTRVHVGAIMVVCLWIAIAVWLRWSVAGFELRVVGENPRVARHALIPVANLLLAAFLVSGALAGMTGANDVLSTKGTFQAEWNPEYGLSAFALVFLARRNPWALVPAALVLATLSYGGDVLPRAADVPSAFVTVFEGTLLIVFALLTWRPWSQPAGSQL